MSTTTAKLVLRALALAALCVLLVAGTAAARAPETRYAAPTTQGTGNCLDPADACTFDVAVGGGAIDGDTVMVPSGTYDMGATSTVVNAALTIQGTGATTPIVKSSVTGVGNTATLFVNGQLADPSKPGTTVRNIELLNTNATNSGGTALVLHGYGASAERVTAIAPGSNANNAPRGACEVTFGTLRDSACVATGTAAAPTSTGTSAVHVFGFGEPVTLRNVTAIATAPDGIGVLAEQFESIGAFHVSLVNTIARGGFTGTGTPTGTDISARINPIVLGSGATSAIALAITHSNYDTTLAGPNATIVDDGTKQDALPTLVHVSDPNPLSIDVHQTSTSPTIGAGLTDDDNGPFELDPAPDGGVRVRNGLTDIGADEFPTALLPPPTTSTTTTTTPPPTTTTPPPTTTTPPPTTTPTATAAVDRTPPVVTLAAVSPSKFAVKLAHQKHHRGVKYGSNVQFQLSERATVVGSVALKTTGRQVGKTCKKQTTSNKRKKKCTLWVGKGSFKQTAAGGFLKVPFTGKVSGHNLKLGSYRVQLLATDPSGNKSAIVTKNFTIRKP